MDFTELSEHHKLLRKKTGLIFLVLSGSFSKLSRYFPLAYTGPSGGYNDERCQTAPSPEALAVAASSAARVWRKDRHPQLVHVGFDVLPNHPVLTPPVESTRVGCTKQPCCVFSGK